MNAQVLFMSDLVYLTHFWAPALTPFYFVGGPHKMEATYFTIFRLRGRET